MRRLALLLAGLAIAQNGLAEIPVEPMPSVAVLPAEYPESWMFALDANFYALIAGRVIIVDTAADTHEYKGAIGAAQFATFIDSSVRSELYVSETFYSRGTTGKRTDVVTIYDKSTLNKIDEVILPSSNRGLLVTNKFAMQLVDDDRYLLVFNFTPASSVSVIDIKARAVLNEIAIPGCSLIYPTGARGFSSLCGNGSMLSVQFDEQGQQTSTHITEPFFSVGDDPVFDKPTFIGDVAYFVSYKSVIYPVDLSGDEPELLTPWSLLSSAKAAENWRPGGWQVITDNGDDEVYVIMQPGGFDGSHKSGGQYLWVANTRSQQVVRQIEAIDPAFSVEFVAGKEPRLAVTNINMLLDIYSPDGKRQRSWSLGDSAMPLALYGQR